MITYKTGLTLLFSFGVLGNIAYANSKSDNKDNPNICKGYGPQTPRDIDNKKGENSSIFSLAPKTNKMNLCNIHFHKNAEHKSTFYSKEVSNEIGYQCNVDQNTKLTKAQLAPLKKNFCKGIKPGDTIEVHWVHSSCKVEPGLGLGACLSEQCANPNLKVEAQVFLLVNDKNATNFKEFMYNPKSIKSGYYQAKSLPVNTGTSVEYTGSATGENLSYSMCSNLSVSWNVRPECDKLDINSLSEWCKDNVFKEDYAHGSRKIIRNTQLLSKIL